MKNKKGFTLIELLIVVAIIGIIAAIAIPNLLRALQKGKQTRTVGDLKTLATSIEAYHTELHFHIDRADAVALNAHSAFSALTGGRSLERDGWGYVIEYTFFNASAAGQNNHYSLGAPCKDGSFGAWTQRGQYPVIYMEDFERDIIYSDGEYTYSPKTK